MFTVGSILVAYCFPLFFPKKEKTEHLGVGFVVCKIIIILIYTQGNAIVILLDPPLMKTIIID